jgi:hypothetical protein
MVDVHGEEVATPNDQGSLGLLRSISAPTRSFSDPKIGYQPPLRHALLYLGIGD